MDADAREQIVLILRDCVDRTIERTESKDSTLRPFHEALLTPEILKISRFERSFSTSFGQKAIEKISGVVASSAGRETERGRGYHLSITTGQENKINQIVTELRDGKNARRPNWEGELTEVKEAGGDRHEMDVTVDLYVKKGDADCFYTIKTVMPNIDQTVEAKRLMLRLKANDPTCEAYYSLYYNPYGDCQADYAWGLPSGVFNMCNDPCVLIGREYWENLGGEGVYGELLEVFSEVGEYTRERLSVD
jgi:hypothetical protein